MKILVSVIILYVVIGCVTGIHRYDTSNTKKLSRGEEFFGELGAATGEVFPQESVSNHGRQKRSTTILEKLLNNAKDMAKILKKNPKEFVSEVHEFVKAVAKDTEKSEEQVAGKVFTIFQRVMTRFALRFFSKVSDFQAKLGDCKKDAAEEEEYWKCFMSIL